MPNHHQTIRSFESQIVPGVRITLKKTSEKGRAHLMRDLAPHIETERAITKRFSELQDRSELVFQGEDENGRPKPKMDPTTCEQVKQLLHDDLPVAESLINELDCFRMLTLYPIYIKHFVKGIDGLFIDDRPATIEDFFGDEVPDGLIQETIDVILGNVDLTSAEKKISQSVSTTEEAEQPSTQATNATTAQSTDTSPEEIALSTSPN